MREVCEEGCEGLSANIGCLKKLRMNSDKTLHERFQLSLKYLGLDLYSTPPKMTSV